MRFAIIVLSAVFLLAGCAHRGPETGWATLIDGEKGMENFERLGDVNWRAENGAIVGDKGKGGHLVTKNSYQDFEIYAEFWADHTTNSGIYVRAPNPKAISPASAYEVNIYDRRGGPEYSTGAIVNHAVVPVPNPHLVGGKWSTMEIRAQGSEISVWIDGFFTARMTKATNLAGYVSLQFGNGEKGAPGGAIKWRKVLVRSL